MQVHKTFSTRGQKTRIAVTCFMSDYFLLFIILGSMLKQLIYKAPAFFPPDVISYSVYVNQHCC